MQEEKAGKNEPDDHPDEVIERTLLSLKKNNFEAYLVSSPQQARELFFRELLPKMDFQTYAWGDSMSLHETGVLEELQKDPGKIRIQTFSPDYSLEQKIYWRRQALLADLFLSGSNALTAKGQLVNLDMIGNRAGAIAFGPKHVVLFIGTNKIVPDLDHAFERIREKAAPANAARHKGFRTPCIKTGSCMDCQSPDRICNTWVITEKSYPKGRISVILIQKDLGL